MLKIEHLVIQRHIKEHFLLLLNTTTNQFKLNSINYRILVTGNLLKEVVTPESAQVFRFDEEYSLDVETVSIPIM